MPHTTINAISTTMLRAPWPQTQWLQGHALADTRNILVLDLETADGIVGMGYARRGQHQSGLGRRRLHWRHQRSHHRGERNERAGREAPHLLAGDHHQSPARL